MNQLKKTLESYRVNERRLKYEENVNKGVANINEDEIVWSVELFRTYTGAHMELATCNVKSFIMDEKWNERCLLFDVGLKRILEMHRRMLRPQNMI